MVVCIREVIGNLGEPLTGANALRLASILRDLLRTFLQVRVSPRLPAVHRWAAGRGPGVLVELGVAEQRYRAVLEVLDNGAGVTDVARRYGVARQTVHGWLRRCVNDGGLVDRSSRPHQMSAVIEAQVAGLALFSESSLLAL